MCCGETRVLDLPADVIEMLARYRQLQRERPWDWGDERIDMFRWMRFGRFGDVMAAFERTGDWLAAVRDVVSRGTGGEVPAGVVLVQVDDAGRPTLRHGPARAAIGGRATHLDVVVSAAVSSTLDVAGDILDVPADGVGYSRVGVDVAGEAPLVRCGSDVLSLAGAVIARPAVTITVQSARCARWSVTDPTGEAWFPDGVLPKWDVHHRPFFHARRADLRVPLGAMKVTCTRGIEYDLVEQHVDAGAEGTVVELDPPRLVDPAAEGWYGGDLHVHLNYSGDLVCSPQDAIRMQHGEGLHLLNLTAANLQTTLVYDEELLATHAGADLPGGDAEHITRMGMEYRNDLLGHVHAFGLTAMPGHFYSGHERTDRPDDWPPNGVACAQLRDLGATVGYAHPAFTPFEGGEMDAFFANPRSVEARELIVDAALGNVDSIDLLSPFDDEGAIFLYHRLLSCGLRLAATAGTDAFLSFSHGPGVASNPPGWARVYADLRGEPLHADAFRRAIQAGRTVATNGPWLSLDLDGHSPGDVVHAEPGSVLPVRATVRGLPVQEVSIVGPDGVLASAAGDVDTDLHITGPIWIAAVARGPGDHRVLDTRTLAHTSPVHVEVEETRVSRNADAQWCLTYLDHFEAFLEREGRFSEPATQLADHRDLIAEARNFYRNLLKGTP